MFLYFYTISHPEDGGTLFLQNVWAHILYTKWCKNPENNNLYHLCTRSRYCLLGVLYSTKDAFDTEQVNRSGDACDLWWDTAVLTGLLWFSSFLWDITIWHFGHNYLPSIPFPNCSSLVLDCIWNAMAHAQKPDFVFWRNGWVCLNQWGRKFNRLLAAEVCASAVLDTPCSEVVWRVLATLSIRQFPLHFPSRASPCAVTFQLQSTIVCSVVQCFSTFVRPRPGKYFFYKTRAQSQQIYS